MIDKVYTPRPQRAEFAHCTAVLKAGEPHEANSRGCSHLV
jgi:hypothetical protein